MTVKPHDRFFKTIFEQREHALAHLEAFVAPEIRAELKLSSFSASPTEHVEARLEALEGDLRYMADGRGGRWIFRLMLEAQSRPERRMALRCAWYTLYDIEQFEASRLPGGPDVLPVVYPMVVYNSRRRWHHPRRLSQLYGRPPPALFSSEQVQPLEIQPHLIDLWRMSDAELRAGALGGLPLLVLKYSRSTDIIEVMSRWGDVLSPAWARPDREAIFTSMLEYCLRTNRRHTLNEYREVLNDTITRDSGGLMETWFTRKLAEEERKGHQQGLQEGLQRMLLAQLRLKFPNASVDLIQSRLADANDETLECYGERVLTATTLDEIFEG
ncbi:MAG: Rpn family recombination-promoting nuclease/putative transposase [Bradymonadia bacterium]